MFIPGMPNVPYNHPTHYEQMWRAAHEHDIALCFHRNHGGPSDRTDWDFLDPDQPFLANPITSIRPEIPRHSEF